MDLFPSPQVLLHKVIKMGCAMGCLRTSIIIGGVKYKVIRQIAEGGFSTVDIIEDCGIGKKYALKRITCHSIEDQNTALREVEFNQKYDHPNIVKVIGSSIRGKADILHSITSEVVIVFPLYQNTLQEDLERRQHTNQPFTQTSLLNIFTELCSAIRELHRGEPPLAHRDIKPSNILLDRHQSPVLMDFGSAALARVKVASLKEAAYLQDTAAERCSMTYRPPELFHVASGTTLDERTDIWSLGCLLYALMFFKGPFDSVYERGDSVALAVQGGSIAFPKTCEVWQEKLKELVIEMTNLDINYRVDIDTVLERISDMREHIL